MGELQTPASHVHDFSGFLPSLSLGGGVVIPTYFLIISLTFCVCLYWLVRRTESRGLPRNTALDLSMILMVGGFLGARLFHIFFEEPNYYLSAPWRAIEVWRGGFVWYGGALLGTALCLLYLRLKRLSYAVWFDLFAPVGALGYALGRVACLFTGCCFGAVCILPSGIEVRYPTQTFAVFWELAALAILLRLESHPKPRRWYTTQGNLFTTWIILHAIGRIIMEIFRADPRGPEPLGISVSSWLSITALITACTYLYKQRRQKN